MAGESSCLPASAFTHKNAALLVICSTTCAQHHCAMAALLLLPTLRPALPVLRNRPLLIIYQQDVSEQVGMETLVSKLSASHLDKLSEVRG